MYEKSPRPRYVCAHRRRRNNRPHRKRDEKIRIEHTHILFWARDGKRFRIVFQNELRRAAGGEIHRSEPPNQRRHALHQQRNLRVQCGVWRRIHKWRNKIQQTRKTDFWKVGIRRARVFFIVSFGNSKNALHRGRRKFRP